MNCRILLSTDPNLPCVNDPQSFCRECVTTLAAASGIPSSKISLRATSESNIVRTSSGKKCLNDPNLNRGYTTPTFDDLLSDATQHFKSVLYGSDDGGAGSMKDSQLTHNNEVTEGINPDTQPNQDENRSPIRESLDKFGDREEQKWNLLKRLVQEKTNETCGGTIKANFAEQPSLKDISSKPEAEHCFLEVVSNIFDLLDQIDR